MTEQIETVIIGGGQAGLALSYHLRQLGLEHILLERARLVERWRSQRWDSLAFQFPNWTLELPGYGYAGPDPDGFAPRDEVVRFLERYAALIKAPVRSGVAVRAVRQKPGSPRYLVGSDDGVIEVVNVVLATGPYQEPAVPSVGASLPPDVVQVHSGSYRSPASLPPGAVLVVGSGSSGCQIVEDLLQSGRRVYLSVGRHRRLPRRYRGRDVFWWLRELGVLDQTVDRHPEGKSTPNALFTGVHGGHDIDLRRYAAHGVVLLGHVRGASEGRLALARDVEEVLALGDEAFVGFKRSVDEFVQRTGGEFPEEPAVESAVEPSTIPPSPTALDLKLAGVTAVIWATGFRLDFGWVALLVFDEHGQPAQWRGVTRSTGIFFLGLPWMHKLNSSVLCGVGEDAAYLAEQIAARHRGR